MCGFFGESESAIVGEGGPKPVHLKKIITSGSARKKK